MILQDVLDQLRYGELSSHKLSDLNSQEEYNENVLAQLIAHINMGLLELYTEYPLKRKSLVIELQDNITQYELTTDHALSNAAGTGVKYIKDTDNQPYIGDIIRINSFSDDKRKHIPFNSVECDTGIWLDAYNVVKITKGAVGDLLTIDYQAKHSYLAPNAAMTTEVVLPMTHVQALLYFVAFRVYSSMTGVEHASISSQFYQLFEQEKRQLTKQSLHTIEAMAPVNKFRQNGWV